MRRLRTACERAKCSLTGASRVTVEIDSLYEGADLYSTISRTKFEELCSDLFSRVLAPLEKVLRDAELEKNEVSASFMGKR